MCFNNNQGLRYLFRHRCPPPSPHLLFVIIFVMTKVRWRVLTSNAVLWWRGRSARLTDTLVDTRVSSPVSAGSRYGVIAPWTGASQSIRPPEVGDA
ncbi:hypothetical protein ElyMa_000620500 [Elysia marginata]|uniref:Uncharacterized protein n=1 Tax=Elysia marginata TaxID=1093978 RepID=A0AAV4GAY5_9GAST|nr:hypothetical protein ElyMa_000620500 [Elysia marginata]